MCIKRILIAVDFSESPDELAGRVLPQLNCPGATIFLLHVIRDISRISYYADAYEVWLQYRDRAVKETIERLHGYMSVLSGRFKEIQPIVEVGEPDERIVEVADRVDADIIIVGNHSRTGIQHFIHRNVAERVMRLARKEVLSYHVGHRE
ncbi:MAG: universal stress protein [Spirochaetes bacterium]|nr:universal stress protein [Spirochaetota bacterium]